MSDKTLAEMDDDGLGLTAEIIRRLDVLWQEYAILDTSDVENDALAEKLVIATDTIATLTADNVALAEEAIDLRKENDQLGQDNVALERDNEMLEADNEALRAKNEALEGVFGVFADWEWPAEDDTNELRVSMTDKELAAVTLKMLGYEADERASFIWTNRHSKVWHIQDALGRDKHAFAAEVKQRMMDADWNCDDDAYSHGKGECEASVTFNQIIYHKDDDRFEREISGWAEYGNMAAHPRAVCEAALRAIEQ